MKVKTKPVSVEFAMPLIMLDKVLGVFYENPEIHAFRFNDLVEHLKDDDVFDMDMLLEIIEKLVNDKYIRELGKVDEPNFGYYSLTIEGKCFKIEDGYLGQFGRMNAENIRLANLERSTKANRCFLTWLTFFVALGTLVAAWYYGIEVWKYYHCK